jgi:hypothetical protein
VVVNQFDIKSILSLKTENDAPISSDGHGPEAPQIAFERMEPVAGEVERLRSRGLIEAAQNVLHIFPQIRPYPAPVALLMKPFQAAMIEAPNHQDTPVSSTYRLSSAALHCALSCRIDAMVDYFKLAAA